VPPRDPGALAEGIYRFLADGQARTRAIAAGLQRAAQFRWEAFGRHTLECYEDVHAAYRRRKSARRWILRCHSIFP
jgi:glycosyltransferase involved in cell wall biosynthesis